MLHGGPLVLLLQTLTSMYAFCLCVCLIIQDAYMYQQRSLMLELHIRVLPTDRRQADNPYADANAGNFSNSFDDYFSSLSTGSSDRAAEPEAATPEPQR